MSRLAKRLEKHFATCAAATASFGGLSNDSAVNAAVIYSGVVNITIPGNFAGVYLNLVTGHTGTSATAVPGYDVCPYYGGNRIFILDSPAGTPGIRANGPAGFGQVLNLPAESIVGPLQNFFAGDPFLTAQFTAGIPATAGLRFYRESDGATLYGWFNFKKGATDTSPGVLVDYWYSSNGGGVTTGVLCVLPGDVVHNSHVDIDDLVEVITHWGGCVNPNACPADDNDDGTVDMNDLLRVITHWGGGGC